MRKILIIDTSMLCVLLEIPGKETCGPDSDRWDKQKVTAKIQQEEKTKTIFVLPLATIIETGNHIAQANKQRYKLAQELANLINAAVDETKPWVAFSRQSELWDNDSLRKLATEWPELAKNGTSMGDLTIKKIADFYSNLGYKVEILTGDQKLKSYESSASPPRRRNST